MTAFRRSDLLVGPWGARFNGRWMPCSHGRGGISWRKAEGDGRSPVGCYRVVACVFRSDRVGFPTVPSPSFTVDYGRIWSDDPEDPNYNSCQRSFDYGFSHEKLRRSDQQYDLVGVLDYNWPDPKPGLGSAIFLHFWRKPRHPTAGCIAFRPQDLIWILSLWTARSRVIIRPGGGL